MAAPTPLLIIIIFSHYNFLYHYNYIYIIHTWGAVWGLFGSYQIFNANMWILANTVILGLWKLHLYLLDTYTQSLSKHSISVTMSQETNPLLIKKKKLGFLYYN